METYVAGSCSTNSGDTLNAVQVAYKNGAYFALGDVGTYTGGPGNLYEYNGTCWVQLTGGPSSDTIVSINTDNSPLFFSGSTGPYGVWATDNANTLWAWCSGATCAAPPF